MKGMGFSLENERNGVLIGKICYYRSTKYRYNLSDSDTVHILIIIGMYC